MYCVCILPCVLYIYTIDHKCYRSFVNARLAQLVEQLVYTEKVASSSLAARTRMITKGGKGDGITEER
jgi:hypothetical protein